MARPLGYFYYLCFEIAFASKSPYCICWLETSISLLYSKIFPQRNLSYACGIFSYYPDFEIFAYTYTKWAFEVDLFFNLNFLICDYFSHLL